MEKGNHRQRLNDYFIDFRVFIEFCVLSIIIWRVSMKLIGLLFLTLVMISCGKSKEEKALCEAFDAFDACAQRASLEEIKSCSDSAATSLNNKLGGGKAEVSTSQREQMISAGSVFAECLLDAVTAANAEQHAGGFGALASDLSTTAEKEAKEKAILEKFKSSYRTCLSTYTTKGREVLKCN